MEVEDMLGIREKMALLLLVVVGIVLGVLWILESQVRSSMLVSVSPLSLYHGYMIGIVFPEAGYIKAVWNPKSGRAHNPFTGKFTTTALFVLIGASIAIVGYLVINLYVVPFLESLFSSLILGSYLGLVVYGAWMLVAFPLLPVILFAIASPAGLRRALTSIQRHIHLT